MYRKTGYCNKVLFSIRVTNPVAGIANQETVIAKYRFYSLYSRYKFTISKEIPENPQTEYGATTGSEITGQNIKPSIMKKLILSFLSATLFMLSSTGQNTRMGITAGLAFSNYTSKVDGDNESGDSKAGVAVGVVTDVPLGKNLSFQPAVHYVQKGTKNEETSGGETFKMKLNIHCIEVPLNLLYNASSNTGTFFIGAGPTFGFSLSGKISYKSDTGSDSEKIEIGNDPDNDFMKGFDVGANILAGYHLYNGILIATGHNKINK